MTSTVDKLLKLDECDCRQAIRVSRKYRKANKATAKFIDDEGLKIKIESNKTNSIIVNNLTNLGEREYCKAIRCAKQYRKANKMLDSAIANYVCLAKEDCAV